MAISPAPQTVDASGSVSRVLASYRDAIGAIVREVTGDPAAVGRAGETYRSGAASSNQASTNVGAISSKLAESWKGSASTAYAAAADGLATRLAGAETTLNQQADSMRRVNEAQVQVHGQMAKLVQGFNADSTSLFAGGRGVPPDAVPQLEAQAHRIGAAYRESAEKLKGSLRQVLAEEAAKLNRTQVTTAAVKNQAPPPPLRDFQQMYDWFFDCVQRQELGIRRYYDKNTKTWKEELKAPRESGLHTVAGPRASFATRNQTIMTNAIETLSYRENEGLRSRVNQGHTPIAAAELAAAKDRTDKIAAAHALTTPAFLADQAEAAARTAHNKAQEQLAKLTSRAAELDRIAAAPQATPADVTAAQAAQKATSAQSKVVADLTNVLAQKTRAAQLEAARAAALLANPDAFVRGHRDTGLTDNDLKNMLLAGMKARTNVTSAEQKQIGDLEKALVDAHDLRVDDSSLTTLKKFRYEDLAGWQRKGVNDLNLGNGSVGQRIEEVAYSDPDHRTLSDGYLKRKLNDARASYAAGKLKNEDAVITAAAKRQNGGTVPVGNGRKYYPDIIKDCYNAKKAAAAVQK